GRRRLLDGGERGGEPSQVVAASSRCQGSGRGPSRPGARRGAACAIPVRLSLRRRRLPPRRSTAFEQPEQAGGLLGDRRIRGQRRHLLLPEGEPAASQGGQIRRLLPPPSPHPGAPPRPPRRPPPAAPPFVTHCPT